MAYVPPFLQALELDAEADERAIRRAYAKRLKRIDPETDPEAFQALREHFEAALEWVQQPAGARLVRVVSVQPGPAPAPRAARAPAAGTASGAEARIDVPAQAMGAFSWGVDDAKGAVPAAESSPAPVPRAAAAAAAAEPERATAALPHAMPTREQAPASARTPTPEPTAPPASATPASATPRATATPPAPRAIPRTVPRIDTPQPPPAPPSRRLPADAAAAAPRPASRTLAMAPLQDPAAVVFGEFVDRFTRTASDEADATRLLREALADERLVNLEARMKFEGRVAVLLAAGWQPGHEHLFKPACDVFEWESDRRRLEVFEANGAVLDAAVRERLIFFAQPAVSFEAQKALIQRLRKYRPVTARELAPDIALLGTLMQRFPAWMCVMTPQGAVQRWIETWNEASDAERAAPGGAGAPSPTPARAGATARAAPRAATRAPAVPPLPPVQPYETTTRGSSSFLSGLGGGASSGTRWMIGACIVGVLRFFGSLGHSPPPSAPSRPVGEAIVLPAPPQPTQADAIRALAARGQPVPDYAAPSGDPNPVETIRQQMRQDATARRQAEMDQRYQEILQSRHVKKATRPSGQDDPVNVLPE